MNDTFKEIAYSRDGIAIGEWLEPVRSDGNARAYKPYIVKTVQELGFKDRADFLSHCVPLEE
jgi:hypothetical protein